MRDYSTALVILALVVGLLVGWVVLRDKAPSDGAGSARLEQRTETRTEPAPGGPAPSRESQSPAGPQGNERARLGVEVERQNAK
jgi:hypothetical protein